MVWLNPGEPIQTPHYQNKKPRSFVAPGSSERRFPMTKISQQKQKKSPEALWAPRLGFRLIQDLQNPVIRAALVFTNLGDGF
jgi:hypothetical protein